MKDYPNWFATLHCGHNPHQWQMELAMNTACTSRLIRIPTGLGKTAGSVLAWAWHRVVRQDDAWPRRLVFCLPMRVLVEQTENSVKEWLDKAGFLWDGHPGGHDGKVGVHTLIGGGDAGEWHLFPNECAVLIGTQDMLLSRALNRGYAAPRARWPMEFGLLNHDALWVVDEVQLMDVGLATSAQLQQFREDDKATRQTLRPCHTWWMSATLQPDWLKSADSAKMIDTLRSSQLAVHPSARGHALFVVPKHCKLRNDIKDAKDWAKLAWDAHHQAEAGDHGRITLVVANTVKIACELDTELRKLARPQKGEPASNVDIRLAHGRFRPYERARWREEFLSRAACGRHADRIIVATQVVEAGVDISATTLVTELAPWPSLVQRFGRAARYGGEARVVVLNRQLKDDKAAAPYRIADLDAAAKALSSLPDVSLANLEEFEERHPDFLPDLYPYEPLHLLLRRELDDLFDTTPDLSGADLDISRFIRSGNERDALVFWREVPAKTTPSEKCQPQRDELCPVPFLAARAWLKDKKAAWVLDYLDGEWRPCRTDDIHPGRVVLVDLSVGGYSQEKGWSGRGADKPAPVPTTGLPDAAIQADAFAESEALSASEWKTIGTHGREVAEVAETLANALVLPDRERRILSMAARWHDAGKAHPAFSACILPDAAGHPGGVDIAKAPGAAWKAKSDLYRIAEHDSRGGFRHELASALALFAVLGRHTPEHDALLGPYRELLDALGHAPPQVAAAAPPNGLEREVAALDGPAFNLLAYLVCAHHGKVRCSWHAEPRDQDYRDRDGKGPPIRGVRSGDRIPPIRLAETSGVETQMPEAVLDLEPARIGLSPRTGAGWGERVGRLMHTHGAFALAYLEALLRAADIRASRNPVPEPARSVKEGGRA